MFTGGGGENTPALGRHRNKTLSTPWKHTPRPQQHNKKTPSSRRVFGDITNRESALPGEDLLVTPAKTLKLQKQRTALHTDLEEDELEFVKTPQVEALPGSFDEIDVSIKPRCLSLPIEDFLEIDSSLHFDPFQSIPLPEIKVTDVSVPDKEFDVFDIESEAVDDLVDTIEVLSDLESEPEELKEG